MSEEKESITFFINKDGKLCIECRGLDFIKFMKLFKQTIKEVEKLKL